ncbi:uncharacterized protein LOC124277668 [Haliotis rubra]|uniref:uncharacterized protein LOC124277668 n=1 Tax=Haliotis rubra TaxID=36100 RepID=UPI001EE50BAB|nr:uncharacterized protein LOC124277668 [Haliotis rubra]
MRRRHQKKMQRVEEPYRRLPSSTGVSQTITTQLKQMKASLQSLLVTWKQDKLELAAICVAVYDDNCLTKILWLDKPGTHIFMLFGNKGVRIEVYGLGKVGNNNDAFFVSVSGRQTLKVTHAKDYSQWETLVLRRKTCDRNLLDAFVMKEYFQMHPTRMVHTHYKMSVEDPEGQTQKHKPHHHSVTDRPLNNKMITTSTATPTHASTLAQTLLQSACNAFQPPTTAYTGLYTVQNPIFQTEDSSALLDRTVDRTFKNALDIIGAVLGTTPVNNQQKHGKLDTKSKYTTQDNISIEKPSSNVSQAINKPHTSLYPIICSDSLSELSGSPTSTDDTDTESTYTSLGTTTTLREVNQNIAQSGIETLGSYDDTVLTALDGANMGTSGITLGEANRHGVTTDDATRYGVTTGDVAEVCAVTPSEAVACRNSVSSENVADISSFLVLDSIGDHLTGSDSDFEGNAFLCFEEFDETVQAPVKKSKHKKW